MPNFANARSVLPARSGLSEAILDVIACPIIALDPAGLVVWWNQAAAVLTGISAEEITGRNFAGAVLFAEDIEKWDFQFSRILAGSAPVSIECRWKRPNGSDIHLACSSAIIRNSANEAAYAVLMGTAQTGPSRPKPPASLSEELMRDRMAERGDLSNFLHGTISQNVVALSFNMTSLKATLRNCGGTVQANRTLDIIE